MEPLNHPRVSIIMPVYNVEKYITGCLLSIFGHFINAEEFEVIFVNDGSSDRSMAIVSELIGPRQNIKMITQENKGLSAARNLGLRHATGDWVWFVDSDDQLTDGSLERVLALIDKFPQVVIFASLLLRADEKTGKVVNESEIYRPFLGKTGRDYLFQQLPFTETQRFLFQRAFLLDHRLTFKPGVIYEDLDFNLRALYLSPSLQLLDRPIYRHLRRVTGSIMCHWEARNSWDLVAMYRGLEEFKQQYVASNDRHSFQRLCEKLLIDAVFNARDHWSTDGFKNFYLENKRLIKRTAFGNIRPTQDPLKGMVKRIGYFISPLYFLKFTLFLRNKWSQLIKK